MSTMATIVENTRRHLMGQHRALYNTLDGAVNATTETIIVGDSVDTISEGNILGLEDELVYVHAVVVASKTLTVTRGFWGTTGVTHVDATLIEINPRFPIPVVRKEIGSEIDSWGPTLFAEETLELSVGSGDRAVDLDGIDDEWFHILRVVRGPRTGSDAYVPVNAWRAEHNMPVATFPSGSALFFDSARDDEDLLITYAKPFDTSSLADAVNLQTTMNMPSYMQDIAEYGAAWRVIVSREVRRTFTEGQGEPRSATEVPPGAVLAVARALKQLRDERIVQASRRLHHRWGILIA